MVLLQLLPKVPRELRGVQTAKEVEDQNQKEIPVICRDPRLCQQGKSYFLSYGMAGPGGNPNLREMSS